jgi:hypothetical protein
MKHSQTIGIIAALLVIVLCFFPWSYVVSKQLTISGFHTEGTSFGKPGLFNIILCSVMIVFFLLPRIWAKRTNIFIAVLNLAWSFRNFLLISACMLGECPEKKPALYAILILSIVIQFMTFLPKIKLPAKPSV